MRLDIKPRTIADIERDTGVTIEVTALTDRTRVKISAGEISETYTMTKLDMPYVHYFARQLVARMARDTAAGFTGDPAAEVTGARIL